MSLLDAIDNFNERLVADALEAARQPEDDPAFLADVMCVALNQMPPRYYRHTIDMRFYLSDRELDEMKARARSEVDRAYAFVRTNQREPGADE